MKFIADVHLGKLARTLRLLGFDTLYKNSFTTAELITIALQENRVLLTRNAAIDKKHASLHAFIIQSENPLEQLQLVLQQFELKNKFHPFSRCIVCNGILLKVAKETIEGLLQENTLKYFHEFWQCDNCKQIYWKGSHYERMFRLIEKLQQAQ